MDGSTTYIEAVTVEVEGHRYGMAARHISRVVRMVEVVPLPGAPEVVAGIIDVAGTVVAVVDPRVRLGLPRRTAQAEDQLVLAQAGSRRVAVWVDRAIRFTRVHAEEVEQVDPVVAGGSPVAGVSKTPDGLLVITDLDAFLSLEEEAQLQAALEARANA